MLYESAQPNDAILRDEAYAFRLFKQAAELGYKFSQFRLGAAFEYGLMGNAVDGRQSIFWYSKAAVRYLCIRRRNRVHWKQVQS